jgi:hypothetical protein
MLVSSPNVGWRTINLMLVSSPNVGWRTINLIAYGIFRCTVRERPSEVSGFGVQPRNVPLTHELQV